MNYDYIERNLKALNMTNSELASMLGISKQAISKWANGGAPDYINMSFIANIFGISLHDFVNEIDTFTFDKKKIAELSKYVTDDAQILVKKANDPEKLIVDFVKMFIKSRRLMRDLLSGKKVNLDELVEILSLLKYKFKQGYNYYLVEKIDDDYVVDNVVPYDLEITNSKYFRPFKKKKYIINDEKTVFFIKKREDSISNIKDGYSLNDDSFIVTNHSGKKAVFTKLELDKFKDLSDLIYYIDDKVVVQNKKTNSLNKYFRIGINLDKYVERYVVNDMDAYRNYLKTLSKGILNEKLTTLIKTNSNNENKIKILLELEAKVLKDSKGRDLAKFLGLVDAEDECDTDFEATYNLVLKYFVKKEGIKNGKN